MYYSSSLKKKRRFTAMMHLKKNVIESLAENFLPEIRAFFESEEGKKEFAEWKEQLKLKKSPDAADSSCLIEIK